MTMRGYKIWALTLLVSLIVVASPWLEAQGTAPKKVFIDQDVGGDGQPIHADAVAGAEH
jgi:hypothetical protein